MLLGYCEIRHTYHSKYECPKLGHTEVQGERHSVDCIHCTCIVMGPIGYIVFTS